MTKKTLIEPAHNKKKPSKFG